MNKKEIYPEYNPNRQKINTYNPSNTFLSFEQEHVYQKLISSNEVTLSRKEIRCMETTGLIEVDIPDDVDWIADMPHEAVCRLSDNGRIYHKYRCDTDYTVRKNDIRYMITTILAVIGAITGVISLLWCIFQPVIEL